MSATTDGIGVANLSGVSRRGFLAGLVGGGGLLLGVGAAPVRALAGLAADESFVPDLWIAVAPDGAVTLVAHRSEMGTGIRTALPMLLADELGADWGRVSVSQAPGDPAYGDQNTDGSRSVTWFYDTMRQAGASARMMLERAAAARWGVDAAECSARDHQVVHQASGRSAGFGELAGAASEQAVPGEDELVLRDRAEWRHTGKQGVPLVDARGLSDGSATFGLDVRREDMLFAVIARPPVLGGEATAWDEDAALAVPGVRAVLPIPRFEGPHAFQPLGGVAVLADDTWSALRGREALAPTFSAGPNASYDSAAYREQLLATANAPGRVVREEGDVDAALSGAARTISADYYCPHLAHAPMEPPCAVADAREGSCRVWAPTQNPQGARGEVARALGLDVEAVTVEVTLLGGGLGRKSKPDVVVEAAVLSRVAGRPVHVTWTREDDLHHDYLHSVAACHLEAGLDEDGAVTGWLQRSVFPPISSTFVPAGLPPARQGGAGELGMGFSDLPFAVPALRVENGEAEAHVRIGWLRSVAHVYHAFATCSFLDELAHARGRDPLEHLLEMLGEDRILDLSSMGGRQRGGDRHPWDVGRLKAVTRRVGELAGWGRRLPRGRGLGVACHRSFLSYVATVVEVDVSREGVISIPNVHTVIDCGVAVHPDRIRAQMEGGAVFGTSLALHGNITAQGGVIQQDNFDTYQLATMETAPRQVHVEIVESDAAPSGVGETAVPPFAPAFCNALFAATGVRVRELPIDQHDLSWS